METLSQYDYLFYICFLVAWYIINRTAPKEKKVVYKNWSFKRCDPNEVGVNTEWEVIEDDSQGRKAIMN